jgi:hemin uptake protein HemP
MKPPDDDRPAAPDDYAARASAIRQIAVVDGRIDSRDLFLATREVIIGHGTETYRLRLTALNKLILTK